MGSSNYELDSPTPASHHGLHGQRSVKSVCVAHLYTPGSTSQKTFQKWAMVALGSHKPATSISNQGCQSADMFGISHENVIGINN